MKYKFLLFLSFLLIGGQFWSCNPVIYSYINSIDFIAFQINNNNPDTLDTIDTTKTYHYANLLWYMKTDMGIAQKPTIDISNSAYAFQFDETYIPLQKIKDIKAYSIYDFDEDIHAGGEITHLLEMKNGTPLNYLKNNFNKEYYDFYVHIPINEPYIKLLKSPSDTSVFAFRIEITHENNAIIYNTSAPFKIY